MTWLGVDVGTTNLKVCRVPGGTTRSVPTPDDAIDLQHAVRRLVGEFSAGRRIEGIGITGMAETGVPLDRGLQPLTKLITWRDQPGLTQAARLRAEVGECGVFARTGLRLSPKLPVVTWRWLRDTQPATVARTRIWAGAPDLALAALTGTYATHLTHAQRLGVLDLRARQLDPELLAYGGLDRLPPIAEPMTVTANTPAGVPVVLCGHDHLVGAWAAGVREPGQVADSLGTSEAVITPSAAPVMDDVLRQQGISVGWFVDGRLGCAISGHGAAGGLVERRLAALERDYDWLSEQLAQVGPPSDRHIAPYPQGRQAPAPDPASTYDASGPADDPGGELRALVDALSLHARWMAEEQTRLLGIEWRNTIAFGGPTRLHGWMLRKAHASGGRDFSVLRGAATGAEGAALMAAEVVTGRSMEPLQARLIEIDLQLARMWDSHFWHRFHKVVARTA
ncbi:hypothetical protein E0H73_28125 [Kribbella pittospori]|uniref:Carbohydrate kinase FGGY N-terminal domain-containing protein n=1 Tax=Kribbella pittospori TaxID=722689 RepID=A0A4R0KJM6_9ACTN|nr:FGGY family carbohydrate kinase [Kribbella pittospori]TCC58188.1 hypothetical protein E0H73_28125 [Kribbella pittospori]